MGVLSLRPARDYGYTGDPVVNYRVVRAEGTDALVEYEGIQIWVLDAPGHVLRQAPDAPRVDDRPVAEYVAISPDFEGLGRFGQYRALVARRELKSDKQRGKAKRK